MAIYVLFRVSDCCLGEQLEIAGPDDLLALCDCHCRFIICVVTMGDGYQPGSFGGGDEPGGNG